MRALSLGLVVLCLAATSIVKAYPTLNGPTGGLEAPSALTQSVGQLDFAVDWARAEGAPNAWHLRTVYGAADNLELGLAYFTEEGGDNDWGFNAKYALPITPLHASVAVGAVRVNLPDLWRLYLVGTRAFGDIVQGSAGFLVDDAGGDERHAGFVNLEGSFVDKYTFGAELFFGGEIEDYGNLYVRAPITGAWSAQVGVRQVFDEDEIALGVNYNFSPFSQR